MQNNSSTDGSLNQLLTAFQQGDDKAFTAIYYGYYPHLLHFGCSFTADKELVKDCIHDVFMKLFDQKGRFEIRNLKSYLLISLRNRLLDELRHTSRECDAQMDDYAVQCRAGKVELEYFARDEHAETESMVHGLLNTLTPRQKEVFQLYYLEERKYDEICQLMSMNYHSVRNLVHRGMLRLRAVAV